MPAAPASDEINWYRWSAGPTMSRGSPGLASGPGLSGHQMSTDSSHSSNVIVRAMPARVPGLPEGLIHPSTVGLVVK